MKKKDKKHVMERKQKRKREETIEGEEPSPELGSTAAEDLDGESPNNMEEEEGMDVEEAASSSKDDSYQKEFKILGQTEFAPLKKINVTTSWVSNATLFPAELHERNLADLSSVFGIPDALLNLVRKRIRSWFPVQKSVLPYLLHDITHVPPVRPRDIAISAPTGSGKTLCYVLPILAQIGARPCGRLRALVIAPVQTLVKQIEQVTFAFSVTTSWVSNATLFPAELHERNLADLSSVFGIPDALLNLVRKRIRSWFPVQKSVLPYLLHDITHVPPVRPRDIAISAPTGRLPIYLPKTFCTTGKKCVIRNLKNLQRFTMAGGG
ncbi:DEAD/DEAH box helicase [Cooperia oncophora]